MCGAVLTWCSDPLVLVTTCEESLVTSPVLLTAPSRSTHYTDSSHCRREQLPPPAWPRPSQHGVDCGVSRSEEAGTITVTCHPVTCTQHTPPSLYTRGTRGTRGARGGQASDFTLTTALAWTWYAGRASVSGQSWKWLNEIITFLSKSELQPP